LCAGAKGGWPAEHGGGTESPRRSAGQRGPEPRTVAHPAAELLDDLPERDAEWGLERPRAGDASADGEHLGARAVPGPQRPKPVRAPGNDRRDEAEGLDVVHERRLAVIARGPRIRRREAPVPPPR